MTVRPAVPTDAAALAEVAAATFALACPPSTTEEAIADFIATSLSPAAFTRYLADPARTLLVAEHESGAPLDGYTMLVTGDPADPDVAAVVRIRPTVELSKIYVREGSHGRGTASELLSRSLDAARDRGAVGIWLGTNQENVRAQRFYVKHGFTRVGTKRFKLGDQYEDDFVFERAL
ncbi:GNAT family N-acetyltransferase [Amnibacterium soli]|uniref:GNAT family N-acetyltransferase n=1 Tax=Amnibacterium soli TaxID=1282736 RepID=A0ABP8YYE1_9MICO